MARIEWDEGAIDAFVANAQAKLQGQVNDTLQSTVREVHHEMAGQPADQVYDVLVARVGDRIPGLVVNEAEMRKVAGAISDGTLKY